MEVSDQRHTPTALPPGKDPLIFIDRRLGGTQSRSGPGGEEKNSQPPPGLELAIILFKHKETLPFTLFFILRCAFEFRERIYPFSFKYSQSDVEFLKEV
jgi:hypothetical protein